MPTHSPAEWLIRQADATVSTLGAMPASEYWQSRRALRPPAAREISAGDLAAALALGVKDFAASRTDVAFLCLIYPVIGLFLAALAARGHLLALLFPTASGFALVGPFAALGLYEISRRREAYGEANWLCAFQVLRSPAIGRIFLLGAVLIGLFLLWLLAALGIYDATLCPRPPASVAGFITAIFTSRAGWAMIGLGLAVGALFAVVVLAIGVVTFPMLLDRPASLRSAVATSVYAVGRNPGVLGLWGVIVAGGLFLGSLPCFLGLIVVLPILGHATWHLYRRLVRR